MELDMECTTVRNSMLEVLYGEAARDAVRRVEEHLEVCGACREEMAAFGRVRAQLRRFTLAPLAVAPTRARPARGLVGLAAAAAIVAGVGAAFVQARVAGLERRLEAEQQSHARELGELRAALSATQPAPAADTAVVERVNELLRASEERQAERLEASLRELSERSDAQRRYDLARVSAGFSYLDGRSGQHAARAAELMGYVLQTAEKK
jgi:hypothetical protein